MNLPIEGWPLLCGLTLLLGIKHGIDADHLAAINALTRLNARHERRFASHCGSLFSLGHGAVVMAVATSVSLLRAQWEAPPWLDGLGGWVSCMLLFCLGLMNLHAAATAAPGHIVSPVGLRSRLFVRLLRAQTPLGVALVGSLFAISFDTLTQALLFSAAALRVDSPWPALALGGLFTLGMLITDGLNGWWTARLIARADGAAALASRVMGFAVAGIALAVGSFGAARLASAQTAAWSEGKELAVGLLVLFVCATTYLVSRRVARHSGLSNDCPH